MIVLGVTVGLAQTPPRITSFDHAGLLSWTNALVPGVCTVETTPALNTAWMPGQNVFATATTGSVALALNEAGKFFRLRSVDVPATAQGFTNFIYAYGLLETLAGNGAGQADLVSYWQTWFEGGPGPYAALSRPHYAIADRGGNVYIADKNSHSILRVATDGTIHTHVGTHVGGFNGEGPMAATAMQLNFPNAVWARADGTVYVLDTDNGRVRRVTTNGVATTLFLATTGGTALSGGRCLWVQDDGALAYFGAKDRLKKWTPLLGVQTFATGFTELGTFYVESNGDLLVADRGARYVYRITPAGLRTTIAGNGTTAGGGDGFPALETGLNGPRGIWPVPTGGYLLLLHDGCQLWYVDAASIMHLLLNGASGTIHSGDGLFFYNPNEWKISEGRSVTMDYAGNIIICESDYGYIRRIRFQRMPP